ncbi:MAG: hypothetical protein CM1200mP2_47490 [Planctomycetaceae bacterium]|nr:MAG: hypothetical protein CM1200mP2_47490 [Planctomycetaceae bacterium]
MAKVKSTIHWVSAAHAVRAEVRLYDHLFSEPDPSVIARDDDWVQHLNPNALETLEECCLERSLGEATDGQRYQFERLGYFCVDQDSHPETLVFNRTGTLRDQWAKLQKQKQKGEPLATFLGVACVRPRSKKKGTGMKPAPRGGSATLARVLRRPVGGVTSGGVSQMAEGTRQRVPGPRL